MYYQESTDFIDFLNTNSSLSENFKNFFTYKIEH